VPPCLRCEVLTSKVLQTVRMHQPAESKGRRREVPLRNAPDRVLKGDGFSRPEEDRLCRLTFRAAAESCLRGEACPERSRTNVRRICSFRIPVRSIQVREPMPVLYQGTASAVPKGSPPESRQNDSLANHSVDSK
jgi:hypothetical protein